MFWIKVAGCDNTTRSNHSYSLSHRWKLPSFTYNSVEVKGLGSSQLDACRKDVSLLGLPVQSLVEMALHFSATDFPPCYVKLFFYPLAIIFADSITSWLFLIIKTQSDPV